MPEILNLLNDPAIGMLMSLLGFMSVLAVFIKLGDR